MNKRQKELYEFLIDEFITGQKDWNSKEKISSQLEDYYPRYLEKSSEHNSRAYAIIRQDVRAINRSDEAEHIIISSKKGYKIATKEEAVKYIEKRFRRDLKSLKLDWHLKKKYDLDRQISIDMKEVKTFIEE